MNPSAPLRTILLLALLAGLLSLTGCAATKSTSATTTGNEMELHAIIVLPVATLVDTDEQTNLERARQLTTGAEIMNRLLNEYFDGANTVKVISPDQQRVLTEGYLADRSAQAKAIGQRLGSDAVLLVTVNRYIERQGADYSAQQPASVAFDYKLMAVKSGRTICSGVYEETQQSLFENLFSLRGAMKRKFKWITAYDLAREGIETRFGECPQLRRQ